jgi:outer membrane protein TolC
MKRLTLATAAAMLAGCAMGPDYQRPEIEIPTQFRLDNTAAAAQSSAISAGGTCTTIRC